MKAVAIFGGTFNPVHLGHRHIIEAAMKAVKLDKIFVVPTRIPPHKEAQELSSGEDRAQMCRLAFSDLDNTEISDHELKNEGKSYSFYTVRHFKELYPEAELYFIMGSDMLLSFHEWYRYREILEMTNIISISRENGISSEELEAYVRQLGVEAGKIVLADAEPFEISSTELRERIKLGLDCDKYLDHKVAEYINEKNLYSNGEAKSMPEKKKYSEYKEHIKEKLSKKRYNHSLNVADAAVKLAKRYGTDKEKAYIAGLLHDVCKELPAEEQLRLAKQSDLNVSEIELNAVPLLHAIAGSVYIREKFGITDEEIIKAIRYHTVACGDMDKLSKIVYIADLISDDRDYKDVKRMRKVAEQGLDKAMLEALRFSLTDSVAKGNTIPLCTLEAYNDLIIAVKSEK